MLYFPRDEKVTIRYSSNLLDEERRKELTELIWSNFQIEEVIWHTSKPGTEDVTVVDLDADVDQDFFTQWVRDFILKSR